METVVTGALEREFRTRADLAHRQRLALQQQEDRERRERRERTEADADDMLDLAAVAVTDAEIESFRADLDTYDGATVAALQENQIELEAVEARMQDLLRRAHTLPDGRRVFKTQGGLRVFDEFGTELDSETIDPNEIDDAKPRWETYKPVFDQQIQLQAERAELLDYQSRLDEARERLDAGDLSRKEFEELRTSIRDEMPGAVREQVLAIDPDAPVARKADATAVADDLEIDDDMVPDAIVRKAPAPGFEG